jgi:hypothetical protein
MSIERHAFPRRVAYQTAIAVGVKHTPGCQHILLGVTDAPFATSVRRLVVSGCRWSLGVESYDWPG